MKVENNLFFRRTRIVVNENGRWIDEGLIKIELSKRSPISRGISMGSAVLRLLNWIPKRMPSPQWFSPKETSPLPDSPIAKKTNETHFKSTNQPQRFTETHFASSEVDNSPNHYKRPTKETTTINSIHRNNKPQWSAWRKLRKENEKKRKKSNTIFLLPNKRRQAENFLSNSRSADDIMASHLVLNEQWIC